MGMFAFRRRQEIKAAASAAAFSPDTEPTPKLEVTTAPTDGNNNRRNGGRRKRQLLPDAGSSGTDH